MGMDAQLLQAAGYVDLVGDDSGDDGYDYGDGDVDALAYQLAAGDTDIVGANGYALARRPGGGAMQLGQARSIVQKAKNAGVKQAVAKLQQRGMLAAVDRPFRGVQRIPAGFSKAIADGATETVTIQAQVPYRPRRFIIAPDIAAGFEIQSMQIGQGLQIMGAEAIPASAIIPDAIGTDWELPTVQTSQNIVMRVKNISGQAATFRGCCWGDAAT